MSFGQAIQTVFSKYAEFRGTAVRSEFWWWILFTALVSMALGALPVPTPIISPDGGLAWTATTLVGLWGIAVLVPNLAVTVRRLRDAGYGWGNLFWLLLPVAGLVVLIVLCAQPTRMPVRTYYAPVEQPPAAYDRR